MPPRSTDGDEPAANVAEQIASLADDLCRRLDRLEELLEARQPDRLLSVAEKAAQLGRSTDYVRDHAEELGGLRQPTTGSRALWRFPAASQPLAATIAAADPALPRQRTSRRRDLLPIGGRA